MAVQQGELETAVDQRCTRNIPREMRREVLERADGQCETCGQKRPLEMHHRNYRTIGTETDGDLDALCRECHKASHINMNGEWWNASKRDAGLLAIILGG